MEKQRLKVKGILLDLDGTIVDSKEAYLEALKTAFKMTGQRMVNAKMATEIPKRLEQNLPIKDLLKGINVQKFLEVYLNAYYQNTSTKTKPVPKVSDTLEKLSSFFALEKTIAPL